jgi:hypothetical protein
MIFTLCHLECFVISVCSSVTFDWNIFINNAAVCGTSHARHRLTVLWSLHFILSQDSAPEFWHFCPWDILDEITKKGQSVVCISHFLIPRNPEFLECVLVTAVPQLIHEISLSIKQIEIPRLYFFHINFQMHMLQTYIMVGLSFQIFFCVKVKSIQGAFWWIQWE